MSKTKSDIYMDMEFYENKINELNLKIESLMQAHNESNTTLLIHCILEKESAVETLNYIKSLL